MARAGAHVEAGGAYGKEEEWGEGGEGVCVCVGVHRRCQRLVQYASGNRDTVAASSSSYCVHSIDLYVLVLRSRFCFAAPRLLLIVQRFVRPSSEDAAALRLLRLRRLRLRPSNLAGLL